MLYFFEQLRQSSLRLFPLIIGILLCCSNLVDARDVVVLENYSVTINNQAAFFDPPLIEAENEVFFPLRELQKYFDLEIIYFRKDDCYQLFFRKLNLKCLVVPNSNEFWIDSKQHFFSKQTFLYNYQLYLP